MNNNDDYICIKWHIDDVKHMDKEKTLTDDDCRVILQGLKDNHDANYGVCWDTIKIAIDNYKEERDS